MRTFQRWRVVRQRPHSATPRLITMIAMLGVVLLVMWQAGDPKNWRWLEMLTRGEPSSRAQPAIATKESSNIPSPRKCEPVAPVFEVDPLELAAAEDEYLAISDGTLKLRREEMPAYWRLFGWTRQQSLAQLRRSAQTSVALNDFVQSADDQRGKLFALELNVRRVLAYDAPENPVGVKKVYEIWGWTKESRAWPYVVVTAELPPGMAVGPSVYEEASFAGYFFKLQGYQAAGAGPKDRPLIAPLLIGRLSHHAVPAPAAPTEWAWSPWIVGLVLLGTLWVALRMVFRRWRRNPATAQRRTITGPSQQGLELADWLAAAAAQPDHPISNSNGKHRQA